MEKQRPGIGVARDNAEAIERHLFHRLGRVSTPLAMSARVVAQSVKDMVRDSGPHWAAAIAYYVLLSAFPLLIVSMTIASRFIDAEAAAVDRLVSAIAVWVPQEEQVRAVIKDALGARGRISGVAFLALIITGTRAFSALTRALNVVFNVDVSHGAVKRFLVELLMFSTVGGVFAIALSSRLLASILWDTVKILPGDDGLAYTSISRALQLSLLLLAHVLLYRYVPNVHQAWRASLIGAAVATGLFVILSPLFQEYVASYAREDYNAVYGPVWIVVVIMIWVWLAALITIFGAEIAAHTQAMAVEGSSAEEVGRDHEERSPTRQLPDSTPRESPAST